MIVYNIRISFWNYINKVYNEKRKTQIKIKIVCTLKMGKVTGK